MTMADQAVHELPLSSSLASSLRNLLTHFRGVPKLDREPPLGSHVQCSWQGQGTLLFLSLQCHHYGLNYHCKELFLELCVMPASSPCGNDHESKENKRFIHHRIFTNYRTAGDAVRTEMSEWINE